MPQTTYEIQTTSPHWFAHIIFNMSRVLQKQLNLKFQKSSHLHISLIQHNQDWGEKITYQIGEYNQSWKNCILDTAMLNETLCKFWMYIQQMNVHEQDGSCEIWPTPPKQALQALVEIYVKDKLDQRCFSRDLDRITPRRGYHILPCLKNYWGMDKAS